MVAHFCHLHSMAIKKAFYGVFMAYFGGSGCPRKIQLIFFCIAQNLRAEVNINKMVVHFCHICSIAINTGF